MQRLWKQSNGFGSMLLMGHDWATPERRRIVPPNCSRRRSSLTSRGRRSRHLMPPSVPAKYGTTSRRRSLQAIDHMTKKYQDEVDSK